VLSPFSFHPPGLPLSFVSTKGGLTTPRFPPTNLHVRSTAFQTQSAFTSLHMLARRCRGFWTRVPAHVRAITSSAASERRRERLRASSKMAARSRTGSFLELSSRFRALLRAAIGETDFETGRRALVAEVGVVMSCVGLLPEVGSDWAPAELPYKLPRVNALGGRAVRGRLSVSTSLLVWCCPDRSPRPGKLVNKLRMLLCLTIGAGFLGSALGVSGQVVLGSTVAEHEDASFEAAGALEFDIAAMVREDTPCPSVPVTVETSPSVWQEQTRGRRYSPSWCLLGAKFRWTYHEWYV